MADPIRVLSLFAGVGGLDLGVHLALPDSRVVCAVEGEAYAAFVLAEEGRQDALGGAFPIWAGDICEFRGEEWAGAVDLIVGGFPCQDLSVAGKQAGIREGTRSGLWFEFARIIGEVGPRFVFVENVRGLAGDGLGVVLSDLADLGFDAQWSLLSAGACGAPHRRDRVFILAHRDEPGLEGRGERGGELQGRGERPARAGGGELAHRDDGGQPGEREPMPAGERGARGDEPHGRGGEGSEVAHPPDDHGRRGERGEEAGTREDGERRRGLAERGLPLFPPGPSSPAWRAVLEEWPELAPAVEPELLRMADGASNRVDRLRCIGNGVVPIQAAAALISLARRLGMTVPAQAFTSRLEKIRDGR